MFVWHVTIEIMLVIIYLLEDEQELSLGMLIRPKRIYNFCLLHASFGWYCYDIYTLPYTFDHIWTNLLTQCTPVPVSVFCCFCISGFPITKTARKIPEKLYKKSAFRKLPRTRSRAGGGPPGLQAPWWRGPPPGRAGGGARGPPASANAPLGIYLKPVAETLTSDPFSPDAIPISAAIAIKLRGTRIPVLAPCRDGEVPPDSSPSMLLPPFMMRE